MPRAANLRIRDHRSEIEATDLRAEVDITTHRGRVNVRRLDGTARINTHRGDVTVDFIRITGTSRIENYRGSTELMMPRSAAFAVDAEVGRHGDFHSDFPLTVSGAVKGGRDKNVRGNINGGGPALRVKSYRGDVRIRQA